MSQPSLLLRQVLPTKMPNSIALEKDKLGRRAVELFPLSPLKARVFWVVKVERIDGPITSPRKGDRVLFAAVKDSNGRIRV